MTKPGLIYRPCRASDRFLPTHVQAAEWSLEWMITAGGSANAVVSEASDSVPWPLFLEFHRGRGIRDRQWETRRLGKSKWELYDPRRRTPTELCGQASREIST